MPITSSSRARRASYEVGYGRPPAEYRFPKDKSGNPGGRPKAAAPEKLPKLDNPILDVILRVAGETVPYKISPGRTRRVTRLEAVVREFFERAAHDQRAFKLLTELVGRASWQAREATAKLEREEERRVQLLLEEEARRQRLIDREEEEREEARLEKNRRRREARAQKRAGAEALEAERQARETLAVTEVEDGIKDHAEGLPHPEDAACGGEASIAPGGDDLRLYEPGGSAQPCAATRPAPKEEGTPPPLQWNDKTPAVAPERWATPQRPRRGEDDTEYKPYHTYKLSLMV